MEDHIEDPSSTTYRDTVFLLLAVFVMVVVLMLPYLNPPANDAQIAPPGSVMASISWREGNDDVDLWMTGPGEPVPVGFSNKGGLLWNLLRDDLGSSPDYTPLNYENSFTRGMPPGEYTVNVDCFRCANLPIDVVLEVVKRSGGDDAQMELVASSTITLTRPKEEKTGLHFEIDDSGAVIPTSMDTIYRPLRNMGGK